MWPNTDDPNSGGFLTDAFSNPWVSVPYAIGSGLLAGVSPGLGRLAQGVDTGLRVGLASERAAYDRKKQQRLSSALTDVLSTTVDKPVSKIGFDPQSNYSFTPLADALEKLGPVTAGGQPVPPGLSEEDAISMGAGVPFLLKRPGALPTYQTTEKAPLFGPVVRRYAEALASGGDAAGAKDIIGRMLVRESPDVASARIGDDAVLYDKKTGQVIQRIPGNDPLAELKRRKMVAEIEALGRPKVGQFTNIYDREAAITENPLTRQPYAGIEDPALSSAERREIIMRADAKEQQRKLAELEANRRLIKDIDASAKAAAPVGNTNDWMRYNETTGDVETAPFGLSREDLTRGGYREIKSLKDREAILSSGTGLELQMQKVRALADEYKKTSWIRLKAGELTGGNIGSEAGAVMEGTARQMIQFMEKELGGLRAGGSKPLIDAARDTLVPKAHESAEVVDLKIKGLDVLVSGLVDAKRRAAFGLGVSPKTKEEVEKFISMVKNASGGSGKAGASNTKDSTPRRVAIPDGYVLIRKPDGENVAIPKAKLPAALRLGASELNPDGTAKGE